MAERTVIYPGTFDPITLGHVDVIKRATKLFDKVIIAVTTNPKKKPLFPIDERVKLVEGAVKGLNVEVDSFDGLLVDYAKGKNCTVLLRGLRELSDFAGEFQQATVNRKLHPEIETVFVMTSAKYFYLNSTVVKELASLQGNVDCFVPENVSAALKGKFGK